MYYRTQNENGTFNTLCLDCLCTVAHCAEDEKVLVQLEESHVCPEKALALLMAQQSARAAAFQLKH